MEYFCQALTMLHGNVNKLIIWKKKKNTKLFIDELNIKQERREISLKGFPIQPTRLLFFPLLSIFHSTPFSYLSWTSFANTNQFIIITNYEHPNVTNCWYLRSPTLKQSAIKIYLCSLYTTKWQKEFLYW